MTLGLQECAWCTAQHRVLAGSTATGGVTLSVQSHVQGCSGVDFRCNEMMREFQLVAYAMPASRQNFVVQIYTKHCKCL